MKRFLGNLDNWTVGSTFFFFVKKNWPLYLGGFISLILTGASQASLPKIIGLIIDALKDKVGGPYGLSHTDYILALTILFVVLSAFLALGRAGWRYFFGRQTHRAGRWLKGILWEKSQYFSKDKLDTKYSVGHLMNASTSDAKTGSFLFGFTLIGALDVVFLGLFTLIAMFSINVSMTLWTLSIALFLPIMTQKLVKTEMIRYKWAQRMLSRFNEECSQAISTIRLQRVTGTGSFWEKRLGSSANTYRENKLKAVFTSLAFYPIFGLAVLASYVVLFVIGINQIKSGSITIGDFVAMQGLIFLMQDPMIELGVVISEIQRSRASLTRLFDIFNAPLEHSLIGEGKSVDTTHPTVFKVENLTYSYNDSKVKVLDNLSFSLKQGERLGIIGPIGTGKSTLVRVLSGLDQQFFGSVSFFGSEIKSYSHKSLRNTISLVNQRNFLFSDTIRNNIALDKKLTDEEIWHYLKVAGIKKDIEKLPNRLDTPLGEWGVNLSGGQKQRLTIARSLAAKPSVLLIDDCLSAVDTVTESEILSNLDKELEGKSVIWIAHRSSTLKYCDKILKMEHHDS